MIWAQLAMSIIIWAGWLAAITFLSEPLADRIGSVVARVNKGRWDDDWVVACYIAAIIVGLFAGLVGIGAWWLFAAITL